MFKKPLDHSDAEDRYIAVGFSDKARALIVVHCENSVGAEIRIISARKATNKERMEVFGGWIMRKEYEFAKLKKAKPKYLKHLKEPVTIRLEPQIITYSKVWPRNKDYVSVSTEFCFGAMRMSTGCPAQIGACLR